MSLEKRISGQDFLRSVSDHRARVAKEKRKIRAIFKDLETVNSEKNHFASKNQLINACVQQSHGDPVRLDPENLEATALRKLDFSHSPCPPLPCGSDDHYIDRQDEARLEAFAMLDASAILRNREANRAAPNIHAFDEQYFEGE